MIPSEISCTFWQFKKQGSQVVWELCVFSVLLPVNQELGPMSSTASAIREHVLVTAG